MGHDDGGPAGHFLGSVRALALQTARAYDDGTDRRIGPSVAKYFCSGYMKGVAVERLYRDARVFRLYEGTSQIQQLIIAAQSIRQYGRQVGAR